jgi:ParB-like chromosome segregation protein Spo0J
MPGRNDTPRADVAQEQLVRLPLALLHAHPQNANLMSRTSKATLAANIRRTGCYPPLIVRHHPALAGQYQLLDGHQRVDVLRGLGEQDALCLVWPCDDATAMLLLATLNRLRGTDEPTKRAALIQELTTLVSPSELALLLPKDALRLNNILAQKKLSGAALLADLNATVERASASAPVILTVTVPAEDAPTVEAALARAVAGRDGPQRRGRALARICRAYLEHLDG